MKQGKTEYIYFIIIAGILLLSSYILGLNIVRIVDNRLSQISINIPPPKVIYKNDIDKVPFEVHAGGSNTINDNKIMESFDEKFQVNCDKAKILKDIEEQEREIKSLVTNNKIHKLKTHKQKALCRKDDDCNLVNKSANNKCVNHQCKCKTGTSGSFCEKDVNTKTYYLDPKLMSLSQQLKFKNQADLSKMTDQDYKNWLSLFKNDLYNLPPQHLSRFMKYLYEF